MMDKTELPAGYTDYEEGRRKIIIHRAKWIYTDY
jgi:hypothetical protein